MSVKYSVRAPGPRGRALAGLIGELVFERNPFAEWALRRLGITHAAWLGWCKLQTKGRRTPCSNHSSPA